MNKTLVPREVIEDAVQLACRAPSYHNSQPWRWIADAEHLQLFVDRDRLVANDESGRQALISCGTVLDHLRVAMAAAGWRADVDYYPDPHDNLHLAAIDFTAMSTVTDVDRRRADAILQRRTDRLPFSSVANGESVERMLLDSVDGDLAALDVFADDARPLLAEASQLSESLRLYDSSYHAELDWWTASFEVSDGIPPSSLISAAESDRVDVGRSFPVTHGSERRLGVPEDRSMILALSALGDTSMDVLRCGEALSAVLLDATLVGLATCTLTHLTEVAASCDVIAALTGRPNPQVLVRVGLAPALDPVAPPTPRRPLSDALHFAPRRHTAAV